MIEIAVYPNEGRRWDYEFPLGAVDPMDFLSGCVAREDHWEVYYSSATAEETFQWLRADMVCRAILAQKEGRPVHFDSREFSDLQEWEDTISSSGQNVSVDRDDENGFWVKSVGPESTKH